MNGDKGDFQTKEKVEAITEEDIVKKLFLIRNERAVLKAKDSKLSQDQEDLELLLRNYMEANSLARTALYEDYGFISMEKEPRIYASCRKELTDKLFDYLKQVGREDMIKESVHPSTLSAYVKELYEKGEEAPGFLTVSTEKQLKYYERKGE